MWHQNPQRWYLCKFLLKILKFPVSNQRHESVAEEQSHKADGVNQPMGEGLKNKQLVEAQRAETDMIYTIEDVPPWYLCILLGLQVKVEIDCVYTLLIRFRPMFYTGF